MQDILILNKKVGETPLECLERFRAERPEYQGIKMTYAGRLDPMAEGLLLVLAGEKVYEKESFLKLAKTYECTAILGVESDTYDVLGLPTPFHRTPTHDFVVSIPLPEGYITDVLSEFVGTFTQPYPPYSSKTINGKQMHTLAREGNLEDVSIPTQTVTVKNILIKGMGTIALGDLVSDITERIQKVTGDFRQAETIRFWQSLAKKDPEKRLIFAIFTIEVSGGTYIRSIVHEWGKKLGISGCIWKLKRTKLGDWTA
jgi:tRNA pseudouridine55 synthase